MKVPATRSLAGSTVPRLTRRSTSPPDVSRRALLAALPLLFSDPHHAIADSDRVRAQTVGIDTGSPLLDPRDPFGAQKGIIWGGRERRDPTDATCQQGGVETDESSVQIKPATPAGVEITDRVRFTLSIAGENAGELQLGLWRSAAPVSVDALVQTASGTYAPTRGDAPASYERSVAVRVSRDKEVVLGALKEQGGQKILVAGQTRPKVLPVVFPSNDDANGLSHDAPGLVSVRKGGGSFEISISTRSCPSLDKELIVVGQVLEGMELLERLNTLPTNNYNAGPMATVRAERVSVQSVQ